MNGERILRSLADRWGFGVERLTTREFEPCKYLDRSSIGFGACYAYFQLASAGALGRLFGASILGEFRKLEAISLEGPGTRRPAADPCHAATRITPFGGAK
jgi:hypothetical protein